MPVNLSILITNYNLDCSKLLCDLSKQAKAWNGTYEIIVIDDASSQKELTQKNTEACQSLPNTRYICNSHNIGAAACRNRLIEQARGEWFIFIDSDAEVVDDNFINNYWQLRHKADVIVGGLLHPAVNPNPKATLRYKYERNADRHRSAEERNQNPYGMFTAFNILIKKKDVFSKVKFDEQCTEYGYEDALFGVELRDKGISILHIDNILLHTGLDDNDSFLRKSETALRTLHKLRSAGKMKGDSRVGNMADKLESLHLGWLYRFVFRITRKLMLRNLKSPNPSLFVFSLYKLGTYLNISKHKTL